MNLSKRTLPSLDGVNFKDSSLTNEKSYSEEEKTKLAYEQFRLDQKRRTGVYKRTDSPVISFELLEIAPKDFFDDLESLTKKVTTDIINRITTSEATVHITNHRKDPTNVNLKENILHIVNSEFSRVDRDDSEVKLLNREKKNILLALVINEIIGLGPLEPLWNESSVTEIMCNGPFDVQAEVGGIVRRIPAAKFRDREHLKSLIAKLYSSINKQLSPVNPRERGRLHDNSRMYAVHEVVAPQGPNFNIRKHSEDYWTVKDIVDMGTGSVELMTYLGNLINAGVSFLVVGGTGTGKTTLLNALTGFIPNNSRGITLEENLEMKPHPGKLWAAPMECLPAKAGEDREFGVTMRDLVRSALQMRPEWAIIGEISDGAAYDLCQMLNTGHSGASTVHANDSADSINRLSSLVSQEEFVKGPAVLDLIGSAFDIIVVVDRMRDGARMISEVVELGRTPILAENGELTLDLFPLWDFEVTETINEKDEVKTKGNWTKVGELSKYRQDKHRMSLVKELSWEELLEISTYNVDPELRGGLS